MSDGMKREQGKPCPRCLRPVATAEEYAADTGHEGERMPIGRCYAIWHYDGIDDCVGHAARLHTGKRLSINEAYAALGGAL